MNLSICLSPCPFLCPYDWKTHWKEGRNDCDFVLLTPPLAGPEPRFYSPQPQVPQPVGHIQEKTHHLKSKPELDSAQEKHLQHKLRIQNTTSLQTSPSRQVQELTGPAHHTTRWLQQVTSNRCISRNAVCNLLSIPFSVGLCKKDQVTSNSDASPEVDITEFQDQRKSDQFVLVATVPLQTRLRLRPSRIQPPSRQRN